MKHVRPILRRCVVELAQAAVVAAVTFSCAAPANGQAFYDVRHTFNIRTNGNVPPLVRHEFVVDTYARTDRLVDNPPRMKGIHTIGAGLHFDVQGAGPVPSRAFAESRANITRLVAGRVSGTVRVDGWAWAVLGTRTASAAAYSYSKVRVRGQKEDRRGNVRFTGRWKASRPVHGGARSRRAVRRDPVVARLIDNTTGQISEWTLIRIHNELEGGIFEWENGTIRSTARDLIFEVDVPGTITTQSGSIRVRVELGVVTSSSATGMFAGTAVPPAGSTAGFSFALPNAIDVDYDMGGDPTHDLVPELAFDNGADANDSAVADWDNGGIVNDVCSGYDLSNVSVEQLPFMTPGVPTLAGMFHLADDFRIDPTPTGQPTELDVLAIPFFQQGAGPVPLPIDAVFVQLWQGNPMLGGFPIAGNMFDNRLIEWRDLNTYRLLESEPPEFNERPVVEALVDMSWAPPLEPGEYWIEFAALGPGGEVNAIPSINRTHDENALVFIAPAQQWQPVIDQSGLPLDFSYQLYFVAQEYPCYADCDQSTGVGNLDIFDFLCFQNSFVAGEPYACACDLSTGPNTCDIFDFLCFQNAFVAGCP